MLNQLEFQTVVLAGLLHDIGKFLKQGSFANLDTSGKHPQVSASFVSAFRECFSQVADVDLLKDLVQRRFESLDLPSELRIQDISNPHTRSLAYLINKAHNLSLADQSEIEGLEHGYRATPLMCVMERLNHESDDHLRLRFHARALPSAKHMSKENSHGLVFPKPFEQYDDGELNQHLKSFYDEFSNLFHPQDAKGIAVDNTNFYTLLGHMTSLIYRYTWCIASNSQEKVPDVSLFDHLKTTAAIATCLYRYHQETDSLTEEAIARPPGQRFCLAVGDLSGIQRYIFDIAHVAVGGGVARRLRARSLYVQLCGEVATHVILHNLKLPMLNMIMNSGGRFYLLLPNLPETVQALAEVQKHVDNWFLENLNGELSLNLAHAIFDEEGFTAGAGMESGFGSVLVRVAEILDQRKQNSFVESISQQRVWQEGKFLVGASFEGRSACRSCRKFPATTKSSPSLEEDDLCIHCDRDRMTGSKLTRANYIAFYSDSHSGSIPALGYSVAIESELKDVRDHPYLVLKLNEADLSDLTSYPAATKYLATHIPESGGCRHFSTGEKHHESGVEAADPATFECIAHRSTGAELLGFLKADVDHLGETFVFGLRRIDSSFDTASRIAAVSRMLDLFFSGWVEQLLLSPEFKDCYTIFSGGDDLFVVGPWDEMPRVAERIRCDLEEFTGNPEKITISAGLLLSKPDFPVARAASEAEELLKASKGGDKNQLTILGHTLSWPEWQVVHREGDHLSAFLSGDNAIPSAFLFSLLRYAKMWRRYKTYVDTAGREGDVLGLRYQPLLAYNIARNLDARKMHEVREWAEALLKLPPPDTRHRTILDNLGLIASLLIYSRRGGKE